MAEKRYSLYKDAINTADQLVVEVGDSHLALVCGSADRVAGFEYYDTTDNNLEEALDFVKKESRLLEGRYTESKIIYNTPEAVLVPVAHFDAAIASEIIDAVFGEKLQSRVHVEHVNVPGGMVNVYRSELKWQELLNDHFRVVNKRHLFSRLLENNDEHNVYTCFYQHHLTMMATVNGQLQLVRSFDRGDDADVLYHLLNTCRRLELEPGETKIRVAGFIDQSSTLYNWLDKYFEQVVPLGADAAQLDGNMEQYPLHYFTPFFKLLS
jgi:hypothetical protein